MTTLGYAPPRVFLERAKDTTQRVLSSGANGSPVIPRLHLLVSIDEKVIEILDANQAEPRILHVRNGVERNRQGGGKNQHVNPASRRSRRHAEAGEQRTTKPKAEQHDIDDLRRMFFAGAEAQSRDFK